MAIAWQSHCFAGSVRYPQGQGCVAFLPPHPQRQKALENAKKPQYVGRSHPQAKTGFETLTKRSSGGTRRGYYYGDELGEEQAPTEVLSDSEDCRVPGLRARNRADPRMGLRIVQYRKLNGLNQETMAKRLGIYPTTLGRWERDESRPAGMLFRTVEGLLKSFEDRQAL